MVKIVVGNIFCQVTDLTAPMLEELKEHLSFTNKSALFALKRFKKGLPRMAARVAAKHGGLPDWWDDWKDKKLQELNAKAFVKCFTEIEGGIQSYSGLVPRISKYVGENQIIDAREQDLSRRHLGQTQYRELRVPQAAVLDMIQADKDFSVSLGYGMIVYPTGTGKTRCAQEIIRHYGVRTLFLVPSTSILKQTAASFEKAFGRNQVKMYGGGKKQIGYVTVATYQSVNLADPNLFDEVGLVVADECFPRRQHIWTEKGPMQIGEIFDLWERRCAPRVWSWNGTLSEFELKPVTHAWRRPLGEKKLLSITVGTLTVVATVDHRFLLSDGRWLKASELRPGHVLLGNCDERKKRNNICKTLSDDQYQVVLGSFLGDGHLHRIRDNRFRLKITHGIAQTAYIEWKRDFFSIDNMAANIRTVAKNGYAQKPAVAFSTLAFDLPEGLPARKGDCPSWVTRDLDERGLFVWFMDDGSHSGGDAFFHTESFSEGAVDALVAMLNDRFGIECKKRRSKGKYWLISCTRMGTRALNEILAPFIGSVRFHIKGTGITNGRDYTWSGGGDFLRHGTGCVSAVVPYDSQILKKRRTPHLYDLEVADNHNFVPCAATGISGIVAHNCHHTPAETFFRSMGNVRNARYRFGLSATPQRADGADLLVEAACGPPIYEYTAGQAIAAGYLAQPSFMMYEVSTTGGSFERFKMKGKKRVSDGMDTSFPYDGEDDNEAYRNWVLGNDKLNHFVAALAKQEAAMGGSVLILVDEKQHGEILQRLLPDAGYSYGGNKDNEKLQKAFNKRELSILLGTSTIGEGSDLVPVTLLIELQGGASRTRTLQADGRALRNDQDENGVPRKPRVNIVDFAFVNSPVMAKDAEAREAYHAELGNITRVALF